MSDLLSVPLDCGCVVKLDNIETRIVHCSLHAAASDLLVALDTAQVALDEAASYLSGVGQPEEVIAQFCAESATAFRAAIAKAKMES